MLNSSHRFLVAIICIFFFIGSAQGQATSFKIGTATKIINPTVDEFVQDPGAEKRIPEIRDNLEANALYLSSDSTEILLVSCDLTKIVPSYNMWLREALGVAAGISPRNVIISSTHAHAGPLVGEHKYINRSAYMKRLQGWLEELAREAVDSARPAKIGWATGTAQIGWNRRFTWADGSHTMGGNIKRADFTGLEGPDDPQHTTLFAKDMNGKLIAVMYNNTTHPTTFYMDGLFSSDFPGYARKRLREEFGEELPVLYLNGAEGDIQSADAFNPIQETDDEKVERLGNIIFNEVMNQYTQVTSYSDDPILQHTYEDLKVGVRLPTIEELDDARKVLSSINPGEEYRTLKNVMASQTIWLQEKFGDAPFDVLPIHAIRIGELAMVTQPTELYSQFGLDIKHRSPAPTTMVVGLADASHGYAPTIYGILGGGFTGKAIGVTRLEPYAGYKIVETAAQLLNKVWNGTINTYSTDER